jgi:hypothetical protein
MGIRLQSVMAKAISAVEISAMFGAGGKAAQAKQLDVFLDACKAAISGFIDVTVPTVLSRVVPVSKPEEIRILCSEELDDKFVPVTSAFAVTGVAKVVEKVYIDGPYLVVCVTVPFGAADTGILVAYTQPGATSNARDLSGNLLANFTAAAVTNQFVA